MSKKQIGGGGLGRWGNAAAIGSALAGPEAAMAIGAAKLAYDMYGRLAALSRGLFGGCLAGKKRCLQRQCGDLECNVGWKFSGNGGRRDFVDFRRVLAEGYLVLKSNQV